MGTTRTTLWITLTTALVAANALAAGNPSQTAQDSVKNYAELAEFVTNVLPTVAKGGAASAATFRFRDGEALITASTGGARCHQGSAKDVLQEYQQLAAKILVRRPAGDVNASQVTALAAAASEQMSRLLGVAAAESSRPRTYSICSCSSTGRPGLVNAVTYTSSTYRFSIETNFPEKSGN